MLPIDITFMRYETKWFGSYRQFDGFQEFSPEQFYQMQNIEPVFSNLQNSFLTAQT